MSQLRLIRIAALLLVFISNLAAAAGQTITVQGSGEIEIVPDVAAVTVEIRSRDKDPEKAQSKLVKSVQEILGNLAEFGIKPTDMGSTSYQFKREARAGADGDIIDLGYYAESSVQIRTTDFSVLPKVIAVSVASGATSIGDIQYSLIDSSKYIDEARSKAFSHAKVEAEKSATAAGMKVGSIKSISQISTSWPEINARSFPASADFALRKLEPILNPGTITVSFSVVVEYELK